MIHQKYPLRQTKTFISYWNINKHSRFYSVTPASCMNSAETIASNLAVVAVGQLENKFGFSSYNSTDHRCTLLKDRADMSIHTVIQVVERFEPTIMLIHSQIGDKIILEIKGSKI